MRLIGISVTVRLFSLASSTVAILTVAILSVSALAVEVNDLHRVRSSITSSEIKGHAQVLSDDSFEGREAGSRGGRATAGYLAKQLQDLGIAGGGEDGGYFQYFSNCRNVIGVIPGSDETLRKEYILIGSHYDHVGYGNGRTSLGPIGYIHNGADDNASGVAGVIELADALRQLRVPTRRSILIAFWDGEEQGLWGSNHWVSHPTVPLNQIAVAINIDMIGRLRDEKVEIFGIRTANDFRDLVSRQNRESNLRCDFNWEMKSNSDHYTFFTKDIPVLMFHTGLHDDYHRPSDDIEKLNVEGIQRVTRFMLNTVCELADRPERSRFRPNSRQETPQDAAQMEEPLPPNPPRLGITWDRIPGTAGLRITKVVRGSAAERSGLRYGDRIIKVAALGETTEGGATKNGDPLETDDSFRQFVANTPARFEAIIRRERTEQETSAMVELDGKPTRLGLTWREDAAEPGRPIVVRLTTGSPAQIAGFQLRDRIMEVNGQRLENGDHMKRLLNELEYPIELLIERQGQIKILTLDQ